MWKGILGTALCFFSALAAEPQPDACAPWALHGYRIGMTMDEAAAVRPLTPAKGIYKRALKSAPAGMEIRQASDPGRFEDGTLYFQGGLLVSYTASIPSKAADRASLESALRVKLGEPLAADAIPKFWSQWAGPSYGTTQQSIWISEACDTTVNLTGAQMAGLSQTIVIVAMESLARVKAGKAARTDAGAKALE
jgi:hypothetical protein